MLNKHFWQWHQAPRRPDHPLGLCCKSDWESGFRDGEKSWASKRYAVRESCSHVPNWEPKAYSTRLCDFAGFPDSASSKEPACQCSRHKRCRFDPWVRKIPWRRAWQPTPLFLPGESHGQRSLVGYSPWGHKESDMTEVTEHFWALGVGWYASSWHRTSC